MACTNFDNEIEIQLFECTGSVLLSFLPKRIPCQFIREFQKKLDKAMDGINNNLQLYDA
jgi:hypothetical protein